MRCLIDHPEFLALYALLLIIFFAVLVAIARYAFRINEIVELLKRNNELLSGTPENETQEEKEEQK